MVLKILQLPRVLKKVLSKLKIDKKKCQQRKAKPLQSNKVWQWFHNLVELILKKRKELRPKEVLKNQMLRKFLQAFLRNIQRYK